jgi:hypothetical protein
MSISGSKWIGAKLPIMAGAIAPLSAHNRENVAWVRLNAGGGDRIFRNISFESAIAATASGGGSWRECFWVPYIGFRALLSHVEAMANLRRSGGFTVVMKDLETTVHAAPCPLRLTPVTPVSALSAHRTAIA